MNIFDYREELTKNVRKTSSLISISELPPEKWILGNYKANEYRTALFEALYLNEKDKRLKLNRITLVDNQNHFDDYIENILLEKVKRHLECYLAENFKKNQLDKVKLTIKNEILEDTYAIFSSIHSSISDSYIIWKDEVEKKGFEDIIDKCLTYNDKKYHEILIYDTKILFVHHENIEEQEKDTTIVTKRIKSREKIKTYVNRWNELKKIAKDQKLGVSLEGYIEKNVRKNFWSNYQNFETLDASLSNFVRKSFEERTSNNQIINFIKKKENLKETWKKYYANNNVALSKILKWHELEKSIDSLPLPRSGTTDEYTDFILGTIESVNPNEQMKQLMKIKKRKEEKKTKEFKK